MARKKTSIEQRIVEHGKFIDFAECLDLPYTPVNEGRSFDFNLNDRVLNCQFLGAGLWRVESSVGGVVDSRVNVPFIRIQHYMIDAVHAKEDS